VFEREEVVVVDPAGGAGLEDILGNEGRAELAEGAAQPQPEACDLNRLTDRSGRRRLDAPLPDRERLSFRRPVQ
jgi:hypothetical protein